MPELPPQRYGQAAIGWLLILAGVVFAVAQALTLTPWQAGIALGLLVAFIGGCMVADQHS